MSETEGQSADPIYTGLNVEKGERVTARIEKDGSVTFANDVTPDELREIVGLLGRTIASRAGHYLRPERERFDLPSVVQITGVSYELADDDESYVRALALLTDGRVFGLRVAPFSDSHGGEWFGLPAIPGTQPVKPLSYFRCRSDAPESPPPHVGDENSRGPLGLD